MPICSIQLYFSASATNLADPPVEAKEYHLNTEFLHSAKASRLVHDAFPSIVV